MTPARLLSAVTLGTLMVSGPARAETSNAEVVAELQLLRERVAQLEAKLGPSATRTALSSADAEAVDRAVTAAMNDADRRGQLLSSGSFTAGFTNDRFVIQSDDGNYVFSPGVAFQFRGAASYRDGGATGGDDSAESGFEVRRLWLTFGGNLITRDLTYFVQFAAARSGGGLALDEAWARYRIPDTALAIKAGQFLNAPDHESAVNATRQLAAERSMLNGLLATGNIGAENYVQGVEAQYAPIDALRVSASYHDGFNSRRTNFEDSAGGSPAIGLTNVQWGVSGRIDYKLQGDWRDYDDFTALGTQKDLLVVGAGGSIDAGDGLTSYLYTVDAQWEPAGVKGLGVYAALVGMNRSFRNVATGFDDSPFDWGALVQAGYLLNDQWELFARYDVTFLDDGAPGGAGSLGDAARIASELHELTFGVNYYLRRHQAKFTVDATWLPNGSPLDMNGANILPQAEEDGQFMLRAQFQLLI